MTSESRDKSAKMRFLKHGIEVAVLCTFLIACLAFARANNDSYSHTPVEGGTAWLNQEALYQGKYSNCDYGYSVRLSVGMVGHGAAPPNPNHGFGVALPDVGSKNPLLVNQAFRVMWIDASYFSEDDAPPSLETAKKTPMLWPTSIPHPKTRRIWVGGVKGARSLIQHANQVSEEVEIFRGGILYTMGLKTLPKFFKVDHETFRRFLRGIKFHKIVNGKACRNGDVEGEKLIERRGEPRGLS